MIDRQTQGTIPPKPHSVLRKADGGMHYEEMFTRDGFDGGFTYLYHLHPVTAAVRVTETDRGWPEAQPEADCECDDETLGEADSVPLTDEQADELKDADSVEDAQPDTVGDDDTDAVALRVPVEQGLGDCEVVLHCDALRV